MKMLYLSVVIKKKNHYRIISHIYIRLEVDVEIINQVYFVIIMLNNNMGLSKISTIYI